MTSIWARFVALFLLILLVNPASAEIYRWIDENGNVRFSDSVPPKASRLERHVLDKQGNLRDVLKRQRTVAELAQHRKRLKALKTERARREEQEKYDRYLWTSFDSLEQLERLRDDRLGERDAQIVLVQDEIENMKRAIARERARQSGNVVAQQNLMRSMQDDLAKLQEKVTQMKDLRRQEFQGLSKDMTRYEYLRLKRAMNRPRF